MTWNKASSIISAGETVILYASPTNMFAIEVQADKTYSCKYGIYKHDDIIGKSYGYKMPSSNSKGFFHLLRPTPGLWTLCLPHRTQILYYADISLITSLLNIRPGSRIAEAGTGSGSFSHSLLRTVGPTGHLYTFEYHKERADKALVEFTAHGFTGDRVTVAHRDVCKDGLDLDDMVDAVFLDLPGPWDAIASAKSATRKAGGRICTFSPCIEQVTRTIEALEKNGAVDCRMFECLVKPFECRNVQLLDITNGDKSYSNRSNRGTKRKAVQAAPGTATNGDDDDDDVKPHDNEESGDANVSHTEVSVSNKTILVSKPTTQMRGHTSYLVFAKFLPRK